MIAAFIGFSMFINAFRGSGDKNWQTQDNSAMAYIQVQNFVKDQLKSPGTATFAGVYDGENVENVGNHKYKITSWVDSQNGFGATMRSNFSAEVEQVSGDDWKCNYLNIEQQ